MDSWTIECGKSDGSEAENRIEMLFLGDVALAGRVGDALLQQGTPFLFDKLPPGFFDADVVCYNLECCLSRRGQVWEPKPVPLRGLPEFLAVFPKIRGRYVANVANNHFLDYGEDAACDTLEAVRHYGMDSIGAVGPGGTGSHVLLDTPAGTVGLMAFAPSVHPLPSGARVNALVERPGGMISQVQALRRQSDVVVVSLHQGVEHTPWVRRRCRILTHRLADAGADCIVCHHPHIIQGIEIYHDVPIFHSIGNSVIDLDFQRWPAARNFLVLRLLFCQGQRLRIQVEPFVIEDSLQPTPATDEQARRIRTETEALSAAFESRFRTALYGLKCEGVKMCERVASFHEMIRREGTLATARYYAARILTKLK